MSLITGVALSFVALRGLQVPPPRSAEEAAEQRYRKEVAPSQRRLAEGREATLIGPGVPLAFHWRRGEGKVVGAAPEDRGEGVMITAMVPSLVELLPDPGLPAYRIQADLRHEASRNIAGALGLYCRHRRLVNTLGAQDFFACLDFADVGQRARQFTVAGGARGSRLELHLCHIGDSSTMPYRTFGRTGQFVNYLPRDSLKFPGPWRTLALEVERDQIRASWEGALLLRQTRRDFDAWPARLRQKYADLKGCNLDLPQRGGLGLYLFGGSVTVRKLTIKPLASQRP
jgi:hypothetical protein